MVNSESDLTCSHLPSEYNCAVRFGFFPNLQICPIGSDGELAGPFLFGYGILSKLSECRCRCERFRAAINNAFRADVFFNPAAKFDICARRFRTCFGSKAHPSSALSDAHFRHGLPSICRTLTEPNGTNAPEQRHCLS